MNAIDLSLVSDQDLIAEYWRRMHLRRSSAGGRKPIFRPCPYCGAEYGARELQKHKPKCRQRLDGAARREK